MTAGEAVDLIVRGIDALEAMDQTIEDRAEAFIEELMNQYPMLMDHQPGPAGGRPSRCNGNLSGGNGR